VEMLRGLRVVGKVDGDYLRSIVERLVSLAGRLIFLL